MRTHARKRSILYQRGVYPPEAFESKKQYGLALWRTTEESLNKYLILCDAYALMVSLSGVIKLCTVST